MAFFKRELSPVERFEATLKEKQGARARLAARLSAAESDLEEKRTAAERLAVADASNAKLERAETKMRAVEENARTLRAALAELDEQIVATERVLTETRAQRDRDTLADEIEAMAAAIEQAVPGFAVSTGALIDAAGGHPASVPEATRFAGSVEAMRREVIAAADLICWELRSTAVRTRAGNANVALLPAPAEPDEPQMQPESEVELQMIYTLNPLRWREGEEVRRVPAFTMVGLPKALLPAALKHQHVDYLNARRVQTLMHVHGSQRFNGDLAEDDPQLIDLDALAAAPPAEPPQEAPQADVA